MATTNPKLDSLLSSAMHRALHRLRAAQVQELIETEVVDILRSVFMGQTKQEAIERSVARLAKDHWLNPAYVRPQIESKLEELP